MRRRAIIALYTRTIGRFRKTRQDFTVNFYFPSTMFTSDLYSFDINLDVTSGQDNDVSITFSAPSADSNDLLAVPFFSNQENAKNIESVLDEFQARDLNLKFGSAMADISSFNNNDNSISKNMLNRSTTNSSGSTKVQDISPESLSGNDSPLTPLAKSNLFNFNWSDELLNGSGVIQNEINEITSNTETINCATLTSTEFLNNFLKNDLKLHGEGIFRLNTPITPPLDDAQGFVQSTENILLNDTDIFEDVTADSSSFSSLLNNAKFNNTIPTSNLDFLRNDSPMNTTSILLENLQESPERRHERRKPVKRDSVVDFSDSSSSDQGKPKKCSDARLSAVGLAKKLNLSSPQEALEREKYILSIFQNELHYPLGYKTWIRDPDKETRKQLIEQLHDIVRVKYPEYDKNILETIIRRATYSMMQSRLRRERRAKTKGKTTI